MVFSTSEILAKMPSQKMKCKRCNFIWHIREKAIIGKFWVECPKCHREHHIRELKYRGVKE